MLVCCWPINGKSSPKQPRQMVVGAAMTTSLCEINDTFATYPATFQKQQRPKKPNAKEKGVRRQNDDE